MDLDTMNMKNWWGTYLVLVHKYLEENLISNMSIYVSIHVFGVLYARCKWVLSADSNAYTTEKVKRFCATETFFLVFESTFWYRRFFLWLLENSKQFVNSYNFRRAKIVFMLLSADCGFWTPLLCRDRKYVNSCWAMLLMGKKVRVWD